MIRIGNTVFYTMLFTLSAVFLLGSVPARCETGEPSGPPHTQPNTRIVINDIAAQWSNQNEQSIRIFMTLENTSPNTDSLSGVESDVADTTGLQLDVMEEDTVMTVKTSSMSLPPGQITRLEPLGPHIVLENLRAPLVPGQNLTVTLRFANSPAQDIVVSVPKLPDSTP